MFATTNNNQHLIVLEKDEPVIKSLTEIITNSNIKGGSITGIGAIKNVEIGYYELEDQNYIRRTFDHGDYELISFIGNISLKNNLPFVHAHISMGAKDFNVLGGHLFEAITAVTAEFYITPFDQMPQRELDKSIGLDLICKI